MGAQWGVDRILGAADAFVRRLAGFKFFECLVSFLSYLFEKRKILRREELSWLRYGALETQFSRQDACLCCYCGGMSGFPALGVRSRFVYDHPPHHISILRYR